MKTEFVLLGQHINVASRARRKWLVALLYAGFGALAIASCLVQEQSSAAWLILLAIAITIRFLGGRTTRGGLVPSAESGDERGQRRKDHAYYIAYKWWDLSLFPAIVAVGLKNNALYPGWEPAIRTFVDRLPNGLLIAAGILYYTLPQAILLWTEPDMEPEAVTSGE